MVSDKTKWECAFCKCEIEKDFEELPDKCPTCKEWANYRPTSFSTNDLLRLLGEPPQKKEGKLH